MILLKNLFTLTIISLFPFYISAGNGNPPDFQKKANLSSMLLSSKKEKKEFPYRQILSFYPGKAITNYMMVGYERQIGPKQIFKVAAGYGSFEEQNISTGFNNELRNFSAVRFELLFKYFIGKTPTVFRGIYFAPYVAFKNSNFEYDDFRFSSSGDFWEEGSASSLATGIVFGFQTPIGENFAFDVFIGNGLIKSSGDYIQARRFMDGYRNSIGILSGFSFGFGF